MLTKDKVLELVFEEEVLAASTLQQRDVGQE
jgi:hypothetical protein